MTEGTKSYLIGCHQFILHPIFVLMAWRLEYRSWPKWWEIICILIHDIGICGKQYLSDDNAKKGHWELGAELCFKFFGKNTSLGLAMYITCGGHTSESAIPRSKLFMADKRSWVIAPIWWLWWNYWVEWGKEGVRVTPPPLWKKLVRENMRKEKFESCHQLYINNRK